MRFEPPSYLDGHAIALLSMTVLHAGLAAWVMMPQAPIAIPQQQIVQVTMVAPNIIEQKKPVLEIKMADSMPKIPPQRVGMLKMQEKPKEPEKKKEEEKARPQEVAKKKQPTAGLQSPDATNQKSAITKPIVADYLNNPPPDYPAAAKRRSQQGTVLLEVLVSVTGKVALVNIARSSGYSLLDTEALQTVKRWSFIPGRRGSEIVETTVRVPIQFSIR